MIQRTLARAIGAVNGKAPEWRTADLHGASAKRQCLQNVGAAADAAIDIDLGLAFQRSGDFRQRRRRCDAGVEMTAAMV